MRGNRWPAVFALVILLAASCSGGDRNASGTRCPKPRGLISIGEPIPGSCELQRFEGGLLRLEDLKGKPAVINFWATWCTFCIDEMPAIEEATVPVRNRVAIIGADLLSVDGETRDAAESFAKKTGVTYDLVYDKGGILFGNFSGQLLLPVTIFVDADGIVAHRQFGPLTENAMTAMLSKYLDVR